LRVTKRIKTRRKEEEEEEKKKKNEEEKKIVKKRSLSQRNNFDTCLFYSLYGKVNLKRQMLVVCCFIINLIWEP
jgi:hypothetical protein